MNSILHQIMQFADQAHGEQMRKYTPERYIVHPLRVMETVKQYTPDVSVQAAALLHDVLEDTTTSRDQIFSFLEKLMNSDDALKIVHLVEELTDIYTKNNYPHWNRYRRKRKEMERHEKTSGDAQTIKYADLIDNTTEIVRQDPDFAKRYLEEAKNLLKRMKNGNAELRVRAMNTVKTGLMELNNLKVGN